MNVECFSAASCLPFPHCFIHHFPPLSALPPASSLPSVEFLASLLACLLAFSAVHYSIYEAVILVQSSIASIMAFSSCLSHSPLLAFKTVKPCNDGMGQKFPFLTRRNDAGLSKTGIVTNRINLSRDWSFLGGSRISVKPKVVRTLYSKASGTRASWLSGTQLAGSVFTLGTVAVLPFYTLMVLAPKSELTKRSMESSVPYIVLGVLYAYLLYLSWTPDTVRLIFASKYMLPELTSIGKMFTNEMTLASAWIHLLAVDLFAARQVFHDGLENQIETRHSVSLCLFFCPIGILTHIITKGLTKPARKKEHHF